MAADGVGRGDRPVRLALIGAGRWGRNYSRTIDELPDVEVAVLCSSNFDTARLVPEGVMMTTDWRKALITVDVDGVIIATPPAVHAEMACAAIKLGLPVMVEKPLTLEVSQAEHIKRRADAENVPVLVDHTLLFHPAYKALKSLVGELGPIRRIRACGGNWGLFRDDTPALWDYGAHDVALCIDLIGETPSTIAARRMEVISTKEGDGHVLRLDLFFPGSTTAELIIGNGMVKKKRWFAAHFDREVLLFDDLADNKLTRFPSERVVDDRFEPPCTHGAPVAIDATLPLTAAVQAFVAGIRQESFDGFGVGLGVEVVRTLMECDRVLEEAPTEVA